MGALKGILSRKPPPSPGPQDEARAAAPPKVEAATPPARGRRYAQLWVGIAILAVLVLLLATLLAWRLGLFGPTGAGPLRELFRSTLLERALQQKPPAARPPEAGRAPAPPPASPAAPPAPSPDPRAEGVGAAAPKPAAPPAKSAVPAEPRYALEFGPFTTAEEAERIERQLNTAGFPTVRFRQQGGGNLYGVFLERVPSRSEAQAIQERLKAAGFAQTTLVGSDDNLSIRVGELAPLRSAVQVADKLRAAGYQVRVAVQPGEALNLAIRHGNFASEEEARARSQDLAGKGLSNRVVRVK